MQHSVLEVNNHLASQEKNIQSFMEPEDSLPVCIELVSIL
jgi:hypothetical protein